MLAPRGFTSYGSNCVRDVRDTLKFTKGKVVIHPHHGPSTVKKIANRTVRGEQTKYLTLITHADELSVSVPTEMAEEIGLRQVMDRDGVREIFEVLMGESGPYNRVWSRRFRDYTQRANSGDIETIAGLVRDLLRRNEERPISYGEKGVLNQANAMLTAELALSLDCDEEEATEMVTKAVLEDVTPELLALS